MVNEPSNVLQIQAGNRGQPCSLLDLTAEEHNAYRQEAQRQYVVQAPQLEPKSLAVTARSDCLLSATKQLVDTNSQCAPGHQAA